MRKPVMPILSVAVERRVDCGHPLTGKTIVRYALLATMMLGLACDGHGDGGPAGIVQAAFLPGDQVRVEELCRSLTPDQAARYGVESAEWKQSDIGISFPHCKVLFSLAKSGAEYAVDGNLLDFNQNIPTSAIARIAECHPKAVVVHAIYFPGSLEDQTGGTGRVGFGELGSPGNECIAFTTMSYPPPDRLARIGEEEALYDSPSSGMDFLISTHAMSLVARDLVQAVFLTPRGISGGRVACIGRSYGGVFGFQLAAEDRGSPCDGILLSASGDGLFPYSELWRSMCAGDKKIPLTGQDVSFCAPQVLANRIGVYDPQFREEILNALTDPNQGEAAAQALLAAYDIATRPQRVQNLAARLTPTGDLQARVLMVQGTHDLSVPAILALRYDERVVADQKSGLFRFYLARGLGHDETRVASVAAFRLLVQWMAGEDPGALAFTVPNVGAFTVLNSTDVGFADDPCGYFDYTVGSSLCRDSGLFP